MKLSHTTLLAILASSALVSAAPTAGDFQSSTTIVKRQELNEVMEHLAELKNLKMKRDSLDENDAALVEIERRADSVLGNLITALANSGIIGDVFHTLTSDAELKNSILAIVKSAVQAAIVQGPTLIKAIFNSGLIQDIFSKILNDTDLRSALLAAGKSIFSSALNLIKKYLASKSSSTDSSNTKRNDAIVEDVVIKREAVVDGEVIGERDLADIVTNVVNLIKESGLVSNLVNKVLADPTAAINFLSSALKNGLVLVEDIFGWAKDNGLLSKAISWIENSDNGIIAALGSFLADAIDSGKVSSDEFDSASSTATATKASTKTAAADTAVITTAAATGSSDSDDLSFLSKYAEAGATTLYKKRMVY